jgi:hypothetical protein
MWQLQSLRLKTNEVEWMSEKGLLTPSESD